MKKHTVSLLLALVLVFSLAGCKSEEAKNVDSLIDAIGEVTLDSNDAITAAEKALDALEEKDAKQVDGTEKLAEARSTYKNLVLDDKANAIVTLINAIGTGTLDSYDAIQQAWDAYAQADKEVQERVTATGALELLQQAMTDYDAAVLAAKVAEVEDAINAIGTVTLDSEEAIQQAWDAYFDADPDVQEGVGNLAVLEAAKETLSDLRAAQVVEAINAIGTVTAEQEQAIADARAAYKALSRSDQAKVTNLDVLEAAEAELKAIRLSAAESLLKGTWKHQDKVRGVTYYYPSVIPHGSEYWYYDQRSFVLPYLSRRDGSDTVSMQLIYCYAGSSWVFFEDITVVADDERFTDSFSYYSVTRDVSGGTVCETAETSVSYDSYYYKMLKAMVDADDVIVRFEGDDYYRDITISRSDKNAIKKILDAYDAFHTL